MFTHHWYSSQEERSTDLWVGEIMMYQHDFCFFEKVFAYFQQGEGRSCCLSLTVLTMKVAFMCCCQGCSEDMHHVNSLTSYFFFFKCSIAVAFKCGVINGEGDLRIGIENPVIVSLLYFPAYYCHCSLIYSLMETVLSSMQQERLSF